MGRRLGGVAFALVLLTSACGDAGGPTTTPTSAPPTTGEPAPTTTSTAAPSTTQGSASPVRSRLDWLLGALGGATVTRDDAAEQFDEIFLAQLPAEQTIQFLAGVAAEGQGPPVLVEVLGESDSAGGFALAWPSGLELILSVSVAAEPPHRINGLFLTPPEPPELENPPQTWDELTAQLQALAPNVGVLAAEVVDGACVPIHEFAAADSFAIGSAFKLWVLGALADAIAAGDVGWDDLVAIREELKSVPSGTMQDEDTGTEFPVFEFAKLMISISDNTATDHLLDLVGRDAVEEAQAALGHADPAVNVPMLTTRELSLLKLALSDAEVAAYLAFDPEGRRAYLDTELTAVGLDEVDFARLAEPRYVDTLEWFAGPLDLCRALVELRQRAAEPGLERLRDVLDTPAAQLGVDGEPWDYLAFKGGSEPGVLAMAILGERSDGRVFVTAFALNDTEEAFSEPEAALYAREAMRLLAQAQ